jgi:hypothetical protein
VTAEQFATLASFAPASLPPVFADLVAAPIAPAQGSTAEAQLIGLGVLRRTADGAVEPVPAVAVTLRVLTTAPFAVQVLAGTAERGVACWWALDGEHGVGLRLLAGGAVELTAFPARHWRAEVTRAVPPARGFTAASESGSVAAGLTDDGATSAPPVGLRRHRIPFEVLEHAADPARGSVAAEHVDPRLLAALAHPAARLQATVLARLGDRNATGQVAWVAAPGGWLALRGDPGTGRSAGARMVDVVPVEPGDLAVELAPLLVAGATRYAQFDGSTAPDAVESPDEPGANPPGAGAQAPGRPPTEAGS